MNNSGNVSTLFTLTIFIIVASLLSFVIINQALAADPELDDNPPQASHPMPPTTSSSVKPAVPPEGVGTGDSCVKKVEESKPTVPIQCKTDSGVYLSQGKDGRISFSSNPTGTSEIVIYAIVQRSLKQAATSFEADLDRMRYDFTSGLIAGYNEGYNDALELKDSLKISGGSLDRSYFIDGYNKGYDDGYGVGLMEISIITKQKK